MKDRHAHLDALRRQLEPEPVYTQVPGVTDSSNLVMMAQVSLFVCLFVHPIICCLSVFCLIFD
ncbi:unnamed protein product [Trichobilharzia regenti]|nr:unnamed protein product [Trichobilharzia regenti]